MQCVPRLRIDREEVGARAQLWKLVTAPIVSSRAADLLDQSHPGTKVLPVQRDGCFADGVAKFVEDLPGEHRLRRQAKDKMFGVGVAAGDDGGGKVFVLIK